MLERKKKKEKKKQTAWKLPGRIMALAPDGAQVKKAQNQGAWRKWV